MKTIVRSARAEATLVRAHELACKIDELLVAAASDGGSCADDYAIRVAQGLTRSLIDQLSELEPSLEVRAKLLARALPPPAELNIA